SQYSALSAFYAGFYDGDTNYGGKLYDLRVRPVRKILIFSNSLLQSISPQAIRGTVTHRRVRPEACREAPAACSFL
ncbi:hypothetical protein ACFZ95_32420, partial [Pseudomonas aeruginosa]